MKHNCKKYLGLTEGTCQREKGADTSGNVPVGVREEANYCQTHGCSMCLFKNKGKIVIEGKKICKVCEGNKEITDWEANEKSLDKELKNISQNFYTDIEPVKDGIFSLKKGILEKKINIKEVKTILSLIEVCSLLNTKEKNDWKQIYKGIGKKKSDLINKISPLEKSFLLNLARERKRNELSSPIPPNNPFDNPSPQPSPQDLPTPNPKQPNDNSKTEGPTDQPKKEQKKKCEICSASSNESAVFMETSEFIAYFSEISPIYFQAVPEKFHQRIKEISKLIETSERESSELELIIKKEKEMIERVVQEKGGNEFVIGQMICPDCYQEIMKNQKIIFELENKKELGRKIAKGIKKYQKLRKELEQEIGKEKIEKLDREVEKILKQKKDQKKYKQTAEKEGKNLNWTKIIIPVGIAATMAGIYLKVRMKHNSKGWGMGAINHLEERKKIV